MTNSKYGSRTSLRALSEFSRWWVNWPIDDGCDHPNMTKIGGDGKYFCPDCHLLYQPE